MRLFSLYFKALQPLSPFWTITPDDTSTFSRTPFLTWWEGVVQATMDQRVGTSQITNQVHFNSVTANTYLSIYLPSETISVKSKGEIAARYGRIFACLIITRTRLPPLLKKKNARKLSFVRRDFCFE